MKVTMSRCSSLIGALLCLVWLGTAVSAQEGGREGGARQAGDAPSDSRTPTVRAVPREGPVEVDGVLDEGAWERAPVATGFVAREPTEGADPSQPTEVKVLYDQDALYVGARLFESDTSEIRAQLVRRDQEGQFDFFAVVLDSNLDRRTGYGFRVSARGVQSDAFFFDDTSMDPTWDAVWESAVSRDARGWTAELRIPLSQVRYDPSEDAQEWGVNFVRRRVASNEELHFSLVSRLQQGFVSQSGRLAGLTLTDPPGSVEIVPYVNATGRTAPSDPGNPFFDGREMSYSAGGELTWNVGGNFNVNATFNPDFGQVESDPAVINLTAFETFFQERRPFFIEDRQLFDFNLSGGNRLFFSRRIGLTPEGDAPDEADFSEIPRSTTILGAGKLTGRTAGGLSVGALGAVTARETGRAFFVDEGRESEFVVQPRTEWGVVSLAQDYKGGDSQIGGMLVALNRELVDGATHGPLPGSALAAGVDFLHRWAEREWALEGFLATSHVRGDEAAILGVQTNSNHFFQRPDARWAKLDSAATHLTGVEWRVRLERQRGEHWTGGVWLGEVSPEFAINDVGFSRDPESLNVGTRISYQEITPGDLLRSYRINLFSTRDWSHDVLDDPLSRSSWDDARIQGRFSLSANLELLNFWRLNPSVGYFPSQHSRTKTRGGPVMEVPASWEAELGLRTDQRSAVNFRGEIGTQRFADGGGSQWSVEMGMELRPTSNWEIQLNPRFVRQRDNTQYATATDAVPYAPTFGGRYIFADVERRTVAMETRMNLAFTPDLTLQLFAQPFISSGDFVTYKQLTRPGAFAFDRFEEGTAVEASDGAIRCQGGRTCLVGDTRYLDFQGDGSTDYSFSDRDFNFRSLIVNAVLRWEYRNGSRLFLVWQRFQDQRAALGDFSLSRDLDALFAASTENVVSLKIDLWTGL